jgi:hypothetical protein
MTAASAVSFLVLILPAPAFCILARAIHAPFWIGSLWPQAGEAYGFVKPYDSIHQYNSSIQWSLVPL